MDHLTTGTHHVASGSVGMGCWLFATIASAWIGGAGSARAQDDEEDFFHLGIVEYELSCIACHGVDGRGDGPDATHLKTRPADLTRITKLNGGTFPAEGLALYIDGRAMVAAHGGREMPVWGDRYRAPISGNGDSLEAERAARARIAALVSYIESLQEP